jgi:hypothetical protein
VKPILALSFAEQLRALETQLVPRIITASTDAAFVRFALSELRPECSPADFPPPIAIQIITPGIAPDLATAGFLSRVDPSLVVDLQDAWRKSFERLKMKEPFPVDRQAFTFRPIEFLGICLGVHAFLGGERGSVEWLRSLLTEQRRQQQGQWSLWLSSLASIVLVGTDDRKEKPIIEDLPGDELALLAWLTTARSFSGRGFWAHIDPHQIQHTLLYRYATRTVDARDAARAGLVYATLKMSVQLALQSAIDESWQVSQAEKDATELVITICRRFHRVVRQISVRHAKRKTLTINDEYDVQDLMHALLTLFFDDVREETWTPNYAGNSSRTDFVLWNESVVVEVKKTRPSLGQKQIADQLIIDKERYARDSRCKTLVCFVYDPDGYCTNPAALESDLQQDDAPRTRVVVVSDRR